MSSMVMYSMSGIWVLFPTMYFQYLLLVKQWKYAVALNLAWITLLSMYLIYLLNTRPTLGGV